MLISLTAVLRLLLLYSSSLVAQRVDANFQDAAFQKRQVPDLEDLNELPKTTETAGYFYPRCRSPCTPSTCSGTACRTVFKRQEISTTSSDLPWVVDTSLVNWLSKRFFRIDRAATTYQPPVDINPRTRRPRLGRNGRPSVLYSTTQIARYLVNQFNGPVWDNQYGELGRLAAVDEDGDDVENPMSQQRVFGTEGIRLGSPGLHGCTVVTIVSRRAVWMAHFWEVLSHGSIEYELNPDEELRQLQDADDQAFRERVLYHFQGRAPPANPAVNSGDFETNARTGRTKEVAKYLPLVGPFPDIDLFTGNNDGTQAFIMTPVADGQGTGGLAKYGKRINELERVLRSRFGARVETYTYAAMDYKGQTSRGADANVFGTDQRGHALFQYDPDADGQGNAAWRLFYEAWMAYGAV